MLIPCIQEIQWLASFVPARNRPDETGALCSPQAIYRIKALRKENDALRNNFRRLKQVHSSALEEVRRVQLAYNRLQEDRVVVDKEYQRLCDTWRAELEDKQRALEQARAHQLQMWGRGARQ